MTLITIKGNILICNLCGEQMLARGGIMQTLVGYSSPEEHNHDDNCMHRTYKCSNGHKQEVYLRRRCPACNWVGKETCGCHKGHKVDQWPKVI